MSVFKVWWLHWVYSVFFPDVRYIIHVGNFFFNMGISAKTSIIFPTELVAQVELVWWLLAFSHLMKSMLFINVQAYGDIYFIQIWNQFYSEISLEEAYGRKRKRTIWHPCLFWWQTWMPPGKLLQALLSPGKHLSPSIETQSWWLCHFLSLSLLLRMQNTGLSGWVVTMP